MMKIVKLDNRLVLEPHPIIDPRPMATIQDLTIEFK